MRVLFSVAHPAFVHMFKNIIFNLEKNGHKTKIIAIDKDRDLELLDKYSISYDLAASSTGKNIFEKAILFIWTTILHIIIGFKFKPDVLISGASPMTAITAFFLGKKHIIYEDTEISKFSLFFCKIFSYKIITSTSFLIDLGEKQIRLDTYKELFYLFPKYFKPDISVIKALGLDENSRFIVVRFVAWNASHDIGYKGLNNAYKFELLKELEKEARVFVSSEEQLPKEFEKYRINSPYEKIHHLLYYALLYIGEGATMASESAVLGTHALYINPFILGYTKEQEDKYQLLYNSPARDAIFQNVLSKAKELLRNTNLWEAGKRKREILLKDKIDIQQWLLDYIDKEIK